MSAAPVADLAVVGAGVVGCAVAAAATRAGHRVVVLEAGPDVGAGTSKANTALWHTGFDAKPGTLESALVARGHALLEQGAARYGWPLERTGALVLAWTEEQLSRLDEVAVRATGNGYTATRALSPAQVYAREPHLGVGVLGALEVPDEGLLDPWSVTLTLAADAVLNGAWLLRNARVGAVTATGDGHTLATTAGPVTARWVVNAAGLGSDIVDRLVGHDGFTITPRRGQLVVFDKLARPLLSHILLPVPTARTKGVLVAPTVYGNVLLGPTAEDLADRGDTATTPDGLSGLLAAGRAVLPALLDEEVTATYAGLRAASEHADYCYLVDPTRHYVRLGGIRSTGVSAALALAERVLADLAETEPVPVPLADPVTPRAPRLAESGLRYYDDADAIAADPSYGRLVCHCERVSEGELRDALAGPVPPVDADGLRRRTRAGAGRCQGFWCSARLAAALDAGALR